VTAAAASRQELGRAEQRKKGTREASGPRKGVYVERRWGQGCHFTRAADSDPRKGEVSACHANKSDNFESSFCLYCHKRSGNH
jgi:hypothetical protein